MKIKSTYGILDVEGGRKALAKRLAAQPDVRVTIEAVITYPFGRDDGVSQEFNMEVMSVREVAP